ncbi:MAG TPA: hypothetical protein VKU19_04860 [Bryobacteraceae bacterium]|nr:hypothetical protein [Bryobacteraceae bacterium]
MSRHQSTSGDQAGEARKWKGPAGNQDRDFSACSAPSAGMPGNSTSYTR